VGTKRKLVIEALLSWAYLEELPKQHVGGNGLLSDLAMLGTPVDKGEIGDRMPVGAGPPHPDALLIDYYVRALPYVRVDWKRQRHYLMGPLAAWLDPNDITVSAMATGPRVSVQMHPRGRVGKKKLRAAARIDRNAIVEPHMESAAGLIMLHARLGTRPIWEMGDISVRPVIAGNNQPDMIGRSTRRGHYSEGSYCPLRLDPPPQEIAAARFEYMVWHQALLALVECARELREYEALPPSAPAQPWVANTVEKPKRVFGDGKRYTGSKLPLTPTRGRPLEPQTKPQNGPVIIVFPKPLTTCTESA
jgi:hypothetical protein